MRLLAQDVEDELRRRGVQDEFAPAIGRLKAELDPNGGCGLSVPTMRAGYYHDYFCPDHAGQLEFDPRNSETHRCPVDGRSFSSARLNAAWLWFVNDRLSMDAFKLAVLGVSVGEQRYLEASRALLLSYARHYEGYEPDPQFAFSGRACFHALDEAVWLIRMTWAYDLAFANCSDVNAREVRMQLLEPAADWIANKRRPRIHNIECWLNAAILTAGVACQRADLIEAALDGGFGFQEQVDRGVLGDGLWYEGSLSYHFYTLAALMWTCRACEIVRPDLARPAAVEQMLLAPIKLSAGDGSLPSNNDCWSPINLTSRCGHGIPEPSDFYETGWAWFERPEFLAVAQRSYRLRPRDSIWVLLEGRQPLKKIGLPEDQASAVFQDSGLAVLRGGSLQLILKYGRHGGVHGHYDKLGLSVYGEEEHPSGDLGTPGFGVQLSHQWYAHTASHNTVLVDGQRQPAAGGSLLQFERTGDFQVAVATVGWEKRPYAGVQFHRAVILRPPYFIDAFWVAATETRQFDWVYHNTGSFRVPPEATLSSPTGEGLPPHPELRSWAEVQGAVRSFQWDLGDDTGMNLFPVGTGIDGVYSAEGPANPASESRTAIVRRLQAASGLFLAVFCPWRDACPIGSVELEPGPGTRVGRLMVEHRGVVDTWTLGSLEDDTGVVVSLA